MDLNTYRQQVLADAALEERVEVNQRHLIDKILARYSTEYTFHRELLQNANDAGATKVEIVFHTRSAPSKASHSDEESKPDIPENAIPATDNSDQEGKEYQEHYPNGESPQMAGAFPSPSLTSAVSHSQITGELPKEGKAMREKYGNLTLSETCSSISFKNNGREFTDADWNRLRSIASGNPDENKIGFFGVGFYSLFSVCEEPFVISGDECMAFYWRGDQLYTKKAQMDHTNTDPNDRKLTTFLMQLRDGPSRIPETTEFARFLATSLAFTANLQHVVVKIDNTTVINLSKKVSDPLPLKLKTSSDTGFFGATITTDKYRLQTPEKLVSIRSVDTRIVQMTCEYVRPKPKQRNTVVDAVSDTIGKTIESAAAAVVGSGLGNLLSGWANPFKRKPKDAEESPEEPKPKSVVEADLAQKVVELEECIEFLFLKIAEANADTHINTALNKQIERATKKRAPRTTLIRVIWNGLSEQEALESKSSVDEAYKDKSAINGSGINSSQQVFSQLLTFPSQGRVFIGFPTHQTTGCCAHLAAALIPTVERESIDFVDPALASWNKELLSAFAILCRILYDFEIASFGGDDPSKIQNKDWLDWAIRSNAHALRFFTPHDTTPSPHIGALLRSIFFACGKQPLNIVTTVGLRPITETRVLPANTNLEKVLKTTPLLPQIIEKEAVKMIKILRLSGYLNPVSVDDVICDIKKRGIFTDVRDVGNILRWWMGHRVEGNKLNERQTEETGFQLINSIVLKVPVSSFLSLESGAPHSPHSLDPTNVINADTKTVSLSEDTTVTIRLADAVYFINQKLTPLSKPDLKNAYETFLPAECLPPTLSGQFTQPQLVSMFTAHGRPIWKELPLDKWVLNIATKSRIVKDPLFAEFVLTTVSRLWPRLPENMQATIASSLASCACIPTTTTDVMLTPSKTYFRNANIFGNLPVINEKLENSLREPFLVAIGVCKHVDLQMVFDRLSTDLNWDHMQLLKYLISVKQALSKSEMNKLKDTKLFPAVHKEGQNPIYFRASELLVPTDDNLTLKLPVLKWPGRFRTSSDEGIFLLELGLRKQPLCRSLLNIAAQAPLDQNMVIGDPDNSPRTVALNYFIEHYSTVYAAEYASTLRGFRGRFLPSALPSPADPKNPSERRILCHPDKCYANPACEIIGVAILDARWRREHDKFHVSKDPPVSVCIARLEKSPPKTKSEAECIFNYLATRQNDFSRSDWTSIRQLKFIPIFNAKSSSESGTKKPKLYVRPDDCYFKSAVKTDSGDYQMTFFNFIEYNNKSNAATFLRVCGVRDEPSIFDIALMIADHPQRMLEACKGWDKYLSLLRQVAVNMNNIKGKSVFKKLQKSACLVGTRNKDTAASITLPPPPSDKPNAKDRSAIADLDEGGGVYTGNECEYSLVTPNGVILVDDSVLAKKFNPWCAPDEDLLEEMYAALGSKWLSELVKKTTRPKGTPRVTQQSSKLEKIIRQRAPLILYEVASSNSLKIGGGSGSKPVRNTEWLQKRLSVRQVDSINLYHTFLPTKVSDRSLTTSCAVPKENKTQTTIGNHPGAWIKGAMGYVADNMDYDEWYLLIAPIENQEWDSFDVSSAIGSLLLDACRIKDTLLISTLLTSSLDNLRRKGFPVDRVLRARKTSKPKLPPLQNNKAESEISLSDRSLSTKASGSEMPPRYDSLNGADGRQMADIKKIDTGVEDKPLSPEEKLAEKQIRTMLPSIDPIKVRQLVKSASTALGQNPTASDIITRATNKVFDTMNSSKKTKISSDNDGTSAKLPSHQSRSHNQDANRSSSFIQRLKSNITRSSGPLKSGSSGSQPSTSERSSDDISGNSTQQLTPPQSASTPSSVVTPQQTKMIRNSLEAAISSTPRGSSVQTGSSQFDLDINKPIPVPPQIEPLSGSGACAQIPVQSLKLIGRVDGVEIYGEITIIPQNVSFTTVPSQIQLPGEYRKTLSTFVSLLTLIGTNVFGLTPDSIHVFVDKNSPVIAFNRARHLFFNLRFFVGLGHADVIMGKVSPIGTQKPDVFAYWFMTFCHELAHHFVADHNASHGFYMSSFAKEYISKLISIFS